MRNFTYAIGDRETGEAVLVDPAYRPGELLDLLDGRWHDARRRRRDALPPRPRRRFAHWPAARRGHCANCSNSIDVPIHVQAEEVDWIVERTGSRRRNARRPR